MRRFSAVLLILFCLAATSRHASWLSSRTQSRLVNGGAGSAFEPKASEQLETEN